MQKHFGEFATAGLKVLAVTQSKPESVAEPILGVPTFCDPDRAAYRYFGLERGRWFMFLRPASIFRYLKLMFAGWRPSWERGEDLLQLGGDFVISEDLRLVYAYRSSDPTARPAPADLLQAIQRFSA